MVVRFNLGSTTLSLSVRVLQRPYMIKSLSYKQILYMLLMRDIYSVHLPDIPEVEFLLSLMLSVREIVDALYQGFR
jgi:hypothetical protein